MRIFEKDGKTNFVDATDCYVGFDAWRCCCEHFGYYFVTDPEHKRDEQIKPELEFLIFDREFFQRRGEDRYEAEAVFRLFDPGQTVYLVLFNHHNGYYSHGFSMSAGVDGERIHGGYL